MNIGKIKLNLIYIGNISGEYNFKNTKIVQPLAGIELANELKNIMCMLQGQLTNHLEIIT